MSPLKKAKKQKVGFNKRIIQTFKAKLQTYLHYSSNILIKAGKNCSFANIFIADKNCGFVNIPISGFALRSFIMPFS